MTIEEKPTRVKKVVGILIAMLVVAGSASAIWYQNAEVKLGTISVPGFADWIIRGKADYTAVYVAPAVSKIQKIQNLICITEDEALMQELDKLPVYKKWVIITPDGNLSAETFKLLGLSKANTILILEGGKQAWDSQVLASSISGLSLSAEEAAELNKVRPYFNESAVKAAVAAPVVRPVSVSSAPDTDFEESEEEEGC